ncbi:hypothetical protein [Actinomadura chokoriensis]|uniref:hypothetical protein n=1 Tax=Actinomadura chokoriensis TaxID=454156 RepID=UPI0031FA1A17
MNSNAFASLARSVQDGSRRAFSMKAARSDGSPLGRAWPFFVQVFSSLFTSGTAPLSISEATSSSHSGSQTHFGSAPSP